MDAIKKKYVARDKRQKRVRKKVIGTGQRPRLSIFKSLNHIYTQLIDDEKGVTLAAASSLSTEFKGSPDLQIGGGNINAAQKVGELIARKAKEHQIESVVFDRGGNLYHGRVKALAEAAREGGLKF